MVKYSFEFNLKIVQEYIDGQVSCYALKVKYKAFMKRISLRFLFRM